MIFATIIGGQEVMLMQDDSGTLTIMSQRKASVPELSDPVVLVDSQIADPITQP